MSWQYLVLSIGKFKGAGLTGEWDMKTGVSAPRINGQADVPGETIFETLNILGEQGWELVTYMATTGTNSRMVFKRKRE
jgi:hypothetical protein